MDARLLDILKKEFEIKEADIYSINGPLDLTMLMKGMRSLVSNTRALERFPTINALNRSSPRRILRVVRVVNITLTVYTTANRMPASISSST